MKAVDEAPSYVDVTVSWWDRRSLSRISFVRVALQWQADCWISEVVFLRICLPVPFLLAQLLNLMLPLSSLCVDASLVLVFRSRRRRRWRHRNYATITIASPILIIHYLQHTYNMQLRELNNKGARAKTLAEAILKNKSRANIWGGTLKSAEC